MITSNSQPNNPNRTLKAVGLLSGGLDSTLAAKIVADLGVEVHGVYFAMPWGCCDKTKAMEASQRIGIKFITLQLDERYLEIVRKPKHGYGSAMNPCIDCRIHMFSRAAQYLRHIKGDFVFTGEVLGQRPMSQVGTKLAMIEKGSGLQGKLLRPLCAQLLEPTDMEKEGLIDRNRLLTISGRSRREQYALAKEYEITEFNQPAGGCSLTDENFSRRIKDTLKYGYRNFRETTALKWGRHFRINEHCKIILGRDEHENDSLMHFAHRDDVIMHMSQNEGPTGIIKGDNQNEEILSLCAGLIQRFSKSRNDDPQEVVYWNVHRREKEHQTFLHKINEAQIKEIQV